MATAHVVVVAIAALAGCSDPGPRHQRDVEAPPAPIADDAAPTVDAAPLAPMPAAPPLPVVRLTSRQRRLAERLAADVWVSHAPPERLGLPSAHFSGHDLSDPVLIAALAADPRPEVAIAAMQDSYGLHALPPVLAAVLAARILDPDPRLAAVAAFHVPIFVEQLPTALHEALVATCQRHPHPIVAVQACMTLEEHGHDPAAEPGYQRLIDSDNAYAATWATKSLSREVEPTVADALIVRLGRRFADPQAAVRAYALEAAIELADHRWREDPPPSASLHGLLETAIRAGIADSDPGVRARAVAGINAFFGSGRDDALASLAVPLLDDTAQNLTVAHYDAIGFDGPIAAEEKWLIGYGHTFAVRTFAASALALYLSTYGDFKATDRDDDERTAREVTDWWSTHGGP